MRLMATGLDKKVMEQFHYPRKFCWTAPVWGKGRQFFCLKGQIVNILDFVEHMITDTTTQLCYRNVKVATDDM